MATYMRFTKTAILDDCKRLASSRNGNPRFRFAFDGIGVDGNSPADVMWAYADNFVNAIGKPCRVKYHFTPKRTIIDSVEIL